MSDEGQEKTKSVEQRCKLFWSGMGFLWVAVLALFVFYPALARLLPAWAGGADFLTWVSGPGILASILAALYVAALLTLIWPAVFTAFLPGFIKRFLGVSRPADLVTSEAPGPQSQPRAPRGSGCLPALIIIASIALLPLLIRVLGRLLGGDTGSLADAGWAGWVHHPFYFVAAIIFAGILIFPLIQRWLGGLETDPTQGTSRLFPYPGSIILGLILTPLFFIGLVLIGLWPIIPGFKSPQIVATQTSVDDAETPTPAATEEDRKTPTDDLYKDLKDTRRYLGWKDENFIEIGSGYCLGETRALIVRPTELVGESLDVGTVEYDPYDKNDAVNVNTNAGDGSLSSRSDSSADAVDALPATDKSTDEGRAIPDDASVGDRPSDEPNALRDLGAPWSLGDYFYRGEEQIDAQEFPEGTHIFNAVAYETSSNNEEQKQDALLIPQVCAGDFDPTVSWYKRLPYTAHSHLVPTGANHAFSKLPSVVEDVIDIAEIDAAISRAAKERERALKSNKKMIEEQGKPMWGNAAPPIIMVRRWTSEEEAENGRIEAENLRKSVQAKHKTNATWIDVGQLFPLCTTTDVACETLNNSITIYVPKRR